ncbi:hypothetical protein M1307_00325 [Patescibacteria group bacterium]|nr:hypothetical protein [Patescibacteria group bacterium]
MKKRFSLSHNYFLGRNGGNGNSSDLKSGKPAKDDRVRSNGSRNGKSKKHIKDTEQLKKWLFFPQEAESLKINLIPSKNSARNELAEKIRSKIISFLANLENFYLVSAEIKFSDGTLPSKANFAAPHMYIFDGMSVLTTFKGETRTNPAIVREAKGRFYFETIIETIHNVEDNDFVEKAAFVKDGYCSLVLANLKVSNHRVHCGTIVMEPITDKNKGDGSLCERSIIPKIEDFIL